MKFPTPRLIQLPVAAIALTSLVSGCAKGPSGGPTNLSSNRLTVTMQTKGPVNNSGFIYSFAFDDDDDSSDGPGTIILSTTTPNGTVAGSFTVLVQYEGGQYVAYRRTALPGGDETLDRASQAFVTQPSPASGNTLSFTLNLDALTDSGARLFRADTQRLDINFITANERRRDPNDNRPKAFDAFGNGLSSVYSTFDIRSTRSYQNSFTVGEPANDVVTNDTTGLITSAQIDQLDITDFTIDVTRG